MIFFANEVKFFRVSYSVNALSDMQNALDSFTRAVKLESKPVQQDVQCISV